MKEIEKLLNALPNLELKNIKVVFKYPNVVYVDFEFNADGLETDFNVIEMPVVTSKGLISEIKKTLLKSINSILEDEEEQLQKQFKDIHNLKEMIDKISKS